MIYLTSETLFSDNDVITSRNRPFSFTAEMDDYLVTNWNGVVKDNDIVIHLGSFISLPEYSLHRVLSRLNGKIYVIKSERDRYHYPGTKALPRIYSLTYKGKQVVLSHYPLLIWNGFEEGSFHIFGKSANGVIRSGINNCCVACDLHAFTPVSIENALVLARMS